MRSELSGQDGSSLVVYHMSQNGSDTSDCGGSVDSACFSFLHVLKLYYTKPPTMGLEIRTEKSLFLDKSTMVSFWQTHSYQYLAKMYLHHKKMMCLCFQEKYKDFRSSRFTCKPLWPGLHISINVTDVSFNNSCWIVMDMNIAFVNCDIANLSIFVEKESSGADVHLHVINSQIGSQIVVNKAAGILEKCQSIPKTVLWRKTLILANNSTITVKSTHFKHVCGAFILNASTGHFRNVKFVDCTSTAPLITGTNRSFVSISNCTYISNMSPLVNVEHMSVGQIANSTIINNSFCYPLSHTVPGLISSVESVLYLRNSHFCKNSVENGSIVGLLNNSVGIIVSSEFTENNNMLTMDHAVILVSSSGIVKIDGSTFVWNKGGAVRIFNGLAVVIKHCLFHRNSANYGGAIYMELAEGRLRNYCPDLCNNWNMTSQTQVEINIMKNIPDFHFLPLVTTHDKIIYNCTFTNNSAVFGAGAVLADNVSFLLLKNNFVNNSVTNHLWATGGAVLLSYCYSNVTNCTFEGNMAFLGGAIYANATTIFVRLSTFTRNQAGKTSLASGGVLQALNSRVSGTMSVVISGCVFEHNKASGNGGAVNSLHHVSTQIEDTTFNRNSGMDGGAIHCKSVTIKNCTFNSNTGDEGGALHFSNHTVISHTNFTYNSAFGAGGAIVGERMSSLSCIFCSFYSNSAGLRQVFTNTKTSEISVAIISLLGL